ncbi:unnamed protein product [Urochloa humidicola]
MVGGGRGSARACKVEQSGRLYPRARPRRRPARSAASPLSHVGHGRRRQRKRSGVQGRAEWPPLPAGACPSLPLKQGQKANDQ